MHHLKLVPTAKTFELFRQQFGKNLYYIFFKILRGCVKQKQLFFYEKQEKDVQINFIKFKGKHLLKKYFSESCSPIPETFLKRVSISGVFP